MFEFLKGDKKKDEEIQNLNDKIESKEQTIKAYRKQLQDKSEYVNNLEVKHEEEVERLNGRIEVLESLKNESIKLQKKEIDLETKQSLFDAKLESVAEVKKHLEEERANFATELEKRSQGSYADGLADGLRRVHEITAEDRKQAMQVAALAASSHTPDAASKVAEGIRDNMMIESGAKKEAK